MYRDSLLKTEKRSITKMNMKPMTIIFPSVKNTTISEIKCSFVKKNKKSVQKQCTFISEKIVMVIQFITIKYNKKQY